MILLTMTIPDKAAELAGWLEERLMAPDFGRFRAELTAMYPDSSQSRQTARELVGPRLGEVLATGLHGLPPETLRQLLHQPAALAELQELILTEGGPYWDGILHRSDELKAARDRGRVSLDTFIG